ncbi:MAG: class I SAM-dependent methyltransferase [Oscillospiraceae bacterium]
MNIKESIESTKKGFEASFSESTLYNRQTQDAQHLATLAKMLNPKPGESILDLGTGSGYVSFEIAQNHHNTQVVGLDITEKTLENNTAKATELQIPNLRFVAYDGINFPFGSGEFDSIVTRYALHHFPDIAHTFSEISRVLKNGGRLLIADPTPNENDATRFVDDYMRMKPDGHIKYYTKDEFRLLGENAGLTLSDAVQTEITFPRLKTTTNEYSEIIKKHSPDIVSGYNVHETDDYIYITQKVWNLCFVKS